MVPYGDFWSKPTPSGRGGHDGGYGSHGFRYGWGLDGMGNPMEPSFIENTTIHDHMNRRKIFGKPANGRTVGYVTWMQKRRPPCFSMKCLPCRENCPKCFFPMVHFPFDLFSHRNVFLDFYVSTFFLQIFRLCRHFVFQKFSEWAFSR